MTDSDRFTFGFTLALALARPACGQTLVGDEDDLMLAYGDKSTISVATGSPQSLRRAPAVASVITAEDIAASGASDLDQIMETVPGVHVNRSALSYGSSYVIRGIGAGGNSNPQVLLVIDGVPQTEIYTGGKGTFAAAIPLTNVARIEIIRGPGSALYGADAYAGVISIVTKSAAQMKGARAGAASGTFGTRQGWFEYGNNQGPVAVAAFLQVGSSKGQDSLITADAQTLNDSRSGTRASLAPGPIASGYDALDASLTLSDAHWHWRNEAQVRTHLGYGAGINSALDPNHQGRAGRYTSALGWADPLWSDNWGLGADISLMFINEQTPGGLGLFPPGVKLGPNVFADGLIGGPARWQRNSRASAYADYAGWRGHKARLGVGHDDLDMYATGTDKNFFITPSGLPVPSGPVIDYNAIQPHVRPQRRTVDYLYLQDQWRMAPDWTWTAGLRKDHFSDFGDTTNPRLALVWDASLDLTAKLLYGRAFRAPSFSELYAINPVINGNAALRPETIATTELALAWQARPDLATSLNLYHYDMNSIITTVANPAPTLGSSYQNAGRAKGRGAEMELAWDPGTNLRWIGNYALQKAVDDSNGKDVGYVPRRHLYTRLEWRPASAWQLSAQADRVAGRARAAGDARAAIADYTTLDATLTYHHGDWDFGLTAHNLGNTDAREPSLAPGLALPNDLPGAGRALLLRLSRTL